MDKVEICIDLNRTCGLVPKFVEAVNILYSQNFEVDICNKSK